MFIDIYCIFCYVFAVSLRWVSTHWLLTFEFLKHVAISTLFYNLKDIQSCILRHAWKGDNFNRMRSIAKKSSIHVPFNYFSGWNDDFFCCLRFAYSSIAIWERRNRLLMGLENKIPSMVHTTFLERDSCLLIYWGDVDGRNTLKWRGRDGGKRNERIRWRGARAWDNEPMDRLSQRQRVGGTLIDSSCGFV